MGKKREIGMQEGIKRWQGDGRKQQALESRMKVSSAPHTEEEKQTTTTKKHKKTQTNNKKIPKKPNYKMRKMSKVCTLSEEKVI